MRVPFTWLVPPLLFLLPLFLTDSAANPQSRSEKAPKRVGVIASSGQKQVMQKTSTLAAENADWKNISLVGKGGELERPRPRKLVEVPRVSETKQSEKGGRRQ